MAILFEEYLEKLDYVDTALQYNIHCKFETYLDAMQNMQEIDQIVEMQNQRVLDLRYLFFGKIKIQKFYEGDYEKHGNHAQQGYCQKEAAYYHKKEAAVVA